MRLPRTTTRQWMVAVAIGGLLMGVAIGGYRLKWRYDYFQSRAVYHDSMEHAYGFTEPITRDWLPSFDDLMKVVAEVRAERRRAGDERSAFELERHSLILEQNRETIAGFARRLPYHAAMARKYRYAALHPWLPVEPDPPEPEW